MSTLTRRGAIASTIQIGGGGAVLPYITGTPPAGVPTELIFDDEFNSGTLNTTIWTPHWYTADQNATPMEAANVAMGSGGVELTLQSAGTGAIITTNPDDGVAGHVGYWVPSPTEGNVYIEWKFTVAATSGVIANWPSVWLEGVDQEWPTQGEIDVMEGLSGQAGWHTHWGATHGVDETTGGGFETLGDYTGEHIYGALWTTTEVVWFYDGVEVGSRVYASEAEITAMNYEKFLNAENAISITPPGDYESTPATCTVRYCRVWQNATADPGPTLGSIPNQSGTVGTSVTINLTATGGVLPYLWTIASQPTGISINASTGQISGTPTIAQDAEVTVTVTDADGIPASQSFSFDVVGSGGGTSPQYPPAGVALASEPSFNCDFATMGNASESAGPYFAPLANGARTTNNASNELANINIVDGQLVLELSSGGDNAYGAGAFVTTNKATGGGGYPVPSNEGFTFATGYIEFDIIVPNGNWWALWVTNSTAQSPYIEYDIAENGNSGADLTTTVHGPVLGTAYQAGGYPNQPAVGSRAVIGGLIQPGSLISYCNGVQQAHIVSGENSGLGAITINNEQAFIIINIGSYEGPIPAYLKVNSVKVWPLA